MRVNLPRICPMWTGIPALALIATLLPATLHAQDRGAAPAPNRAEGDGPFDRLIIRGGTLIDGTGGPPRGPVDIVIHRNRITRLVSVAFPRLPIDQSKRPGRTGPQIQAEGMCVLHSSTCTCTPAATPRRPSPSTSTSSGWRTA